MQGIQPCSSVEIFTYADIALRLGVVVTSTRLKEYQNPLPSQIQALGAIKSLARTKFPISRGCLLFYDEMIANLIRLRGNIGGQGGGSPCNENLACLIPLINDNIASIPIRKLEQGGLGFPGDSEVAPGR